MSYPKEVVEIHNEFSNAAERLLQEAKQIVSTVNVDKGKRLANLGLYKAREAKEYLAIDNKRALQILSYKEKHPLNKFITYENVDYICKKYGLVLAPIGRYKGFVPEKNLKEIEGFKCSHVDTSDIYVVDEVAIKFPYSLIVNRKAQNIIKNSTIIRYFNGYSSHFDESIKWPIEKEIGKELGLSWKHIECSFIQIKTLQICAPVSDMDIKGLEKSQSFYGEKFVHVPDPVILQPVHYGFLIVTAWGDEASDELIVNLIEN